MSFDLKISNGDLVIGDNGDFATVTDTAKLTQDILKMVLTPLGANTFYPWYGSPINKTLIGSAFDMEFASSVASGQLRNSIDTLMKLQKEQAKRQLLSAAEQIAAIKNVQIERNSVNPTFFTINIDVVSKALTVSSSQFDLNPNI